MIEAKMSESKVLHQGQDPLVQPVAQVDGSSIPGRNELMCVCVCVFIDFVINGQHLLS